MFVLRLYGKFSILLYPNLIKMCFCWPWKRLRSRKVCALSFCLNRRYPHSRFCKRHQTSLLFSDMVRDPTLISKFMDDDDDF